METHTKKRCYKTLLFTKFLPADYLYSTVKLVIFCFTSDYFWGASIASIGLAFNAL